MQDTLRAVASNGGRHVGQVTGRLHVAVRYTCQHVMTHYRFFARKYIVSPGLLRESPQKYNNGSFEVFSLISLNKLLNNSPVILDAMGFLPDTQNCACTGKAGNVFPATAG